MQNIPDKLISAYLDGSLDEQQAAELSQWVQASQEHARYIASLAILEHGLIKHTKMQSNSDILAEIQTPDETEQSLPPIHIEADALTKWEYVSAVSYLLCRPFTPKRLIAGGVAAALLLSAVLAIVLMTGPDTTEQIAEQPTEQTNEPDATNPTIPAIPTRSVATLTATHNAQWAQPSAERALSRGSSLHPHQRLTLTAGFAEITTHSGAIAILEAPATIELIDNNALHLHAGKLVGICETDASKGFLVRTPHLDITDVGTEFGVEFTDHDAQTHVQVYRGEVQVASITEGGVASDPITLRTQQAAQLHPSTGLLAVAFDPGYYERDLSLIGAQPTFAGDAAVWQGRIAADLWRGLLASDALQVFAEREAWVLDTDLVVDLARHDSWPPQAGIGQRIVEAGSCVDVYLLHLDPQSQRVQGEYTLRFDQPILGVIAAEKTLRASDQAVSSGRVKYPRRPVGEIAVGGRNGLDIEIPDFAEISEDGMSLELHLNAGFFIDQVRVLVQCEPHHLAIESRGLASP